MSYVYMYELKGNKLNQVIRILQDMTRLPQHTLTRSIVMNSNFPAAAFIIAKHHMNFSRELCKSLILCRKSFMCYCERDQVRISRELSETRCVYPENSARPGAYFPRTQRDQVRISRELSETRCVFPENSARPGPYFPRTQRDQVRISRELLCFQPAFYVQIH